MSNRPEAYTVDAVRTLVGKRGGLLSQIHPADLGAHAIASLMERTGVDPGAIEDVIGIFGQDQSGGMESHPLAVDVAPKMSTTHTGAVKYCSDKRIQNL